jgi:CRP-like cAMP-binding protein
VVACWHALHALDRRVRVRDVDVALLHRVPMLRPLPEATIEQLAASLTRMQLPAGASVFEQGDEGDEFYVIERGRADVIRDGQPISALDSGAGFGEIALIHECRRTASVRAATALTLRMLNRTVFVAAVTGYPQSAQVADRVITSHLIGFQPPPESPLTSQSPPR